MTELDYTSPETFRATGRTTRMLREAITEVKNGDVIVVGRTEDDAQRTLLPAMAEICKQAGIDHFVAPRGDVITMYGHRVWFKGSYNYVSPGPGIHMAFRSIFMDHAVHKSGY
jgi:5,10-methylenetetrahydrofolate reductase